MPAGGGGGSAYQRAIELLIKTSGQEGLDQLNAKLRNLDTAVENVGTQFTQGAIPAEAYVASVVKITKESDKLKTAMGQVGTAAGKSGGGMGYGLLQASQAFDDLQYGVRGVLNNIPGLVLGLGLGPGVAGVLQVGAILAEKFTRELAAAGDVDLSKVRGSLEGLKKQVDDLEKKRKLGFDFAGLDEAQARLTELQRKLDAFNAISGKTSLMGKAGALVSEGITESGGREKVQAAVADIQKQRGDFFGKDPQFEEFQAKTGQAKELRGLAAQPTIDPEERVRLGGQAETLEAEIKKLTTVMTQRGNERIATMVGGAATGDESDRQRLLEMAQQVPGAFAARGVGPKFVAGLRAADPEFIRGDELNQREGVEQTRGAKLDAALKDKAERDKKAKDKATKDWETEQIRQSDAYDDAIKDRADAAKKVTAEKTREGKADLRDDKKEERDAAKALKNTVSMVGPQYMKNIGYQVGSGNVNQQEATAAVGQQLGQLGEDPAQAAGLVRQALADLHQKYTQTLARTNNEQMATVQTLQGYANDIQRMEQQNFMQSQRGRNQRPSLNGSFGN